MLSDRRTNGHGQREPLSVGERGRTNWHGASKELEGDALKNIRDKLGAFGNIFTREYLSHNINDAHLFPFLALSTLSLFAHFLLSIPRRDFFLLLCSIEAARWRVRNVGT